jgi:hypothetical protein
LPKSGGKSAAHPANGMANGMNQRSRIKKRRFSDGPAPKTAMDKEIQEPKMCSDKEI